MALRRNPFTGRDDYFQPASALPAMPHALLSVTHSDTVASAAVRGALIVGNATPAWQRFAIGSAGTFLRSDGTDPAWAALTLADLPAGIVLDGDPAGGDLSGTYPNPSVVNDSHTHTAATLPSSIVYDGDAAGGDLSGTYPNPSVNDDSHSHTAATLPATLVYDGDAAGGDLTGTYPNPTLADADLIALRDLAATAGMLSRTGAGAFAARTLTPPAAGLTISNATGAAGNPTFALANDLAALEGLGSTGIAVRSAADTWVQRSIAAGSGLAVADGDGVSGDPTISLAINALTDVSTPFSAVDYLLIYDDSTASHRRVGLGVLNGAWDHGTITGLGDDDHTQYLLLAGRAGGQSVIGGTASGNDLALSANTATFAHGNAGRIKLNERLAFTGSWNLGTNPSVNFVETTQALTVGTGSILLSLQGFRFAPTVAYDTSLVAAFCPTFRSEIQLRPTTSVNDTGLVAVGFAADNMYAANAASITPQALALGGYMARPSLKIIAGASETVTDVFGYATNYTVDTLSGYGVIGANCTATTYAHFWARPPTKNGTITNEYGLKIDALTGGGTLIAGVHCSIAQGAAKWGLCFSGDADNALLGGLALGTSSTAPDTILHVRANSAATARRGAITFEEDSANPGSPTSGSQMRVYMKADKFVIQYNDGGTVRYKYLDLTGTGVTWTHTTAAP